MHEFECPFYVFDFELCSKCINSESKTCLITNKQILEQEDIENLEMIDIYTLQGIPNNNRNIKKG